MVYQNNSGLYDIRMRLEILPHSLWGNAQQAGRGTPVSAAQ